MFSHYQRTPLEQWIEDIYRMHGIGSPRDLTIENLAARLNTWVYYQPIGSRYIDRGQGMYSVVIDSRLGRKEQWEEFLHELCHVLRHSGNQHQMPEPLIRWQEEHAAHFQLYAAMPYAMLRTLQIPQLQSEAVGFLCEEFGVTAGLAERRLRQIQQRMLQGIVEQEYAAHKRQEELAQSLAVDSSAGCADKEFRIIAHSVETERLIGKLSWLAAQKGRRINWKG